MSRLRNTSGREDHPDAADRHFEDSSYLLRAGRVETAAYLAGYVVECSLKSVLIHDHAWDAAAGTHDRTRISQRYQLLTTRQYGHQLPALATFLVGVEGARYMPDLTRASIFGQGTLLGWSETLRYSPAGTITPSQATAWHAWAEHVYRETVMRMRLDGVV